MLTLMCGYWRGSTGDNCQLQENANVNKGLEHRCLCSKVSAIRTLWTEWSWHSNPTQNTTRRTEHDTENHLCGKISDHFYIASYSTDLGQSMHCNRKGSRWLIRTSRIRRNDCWSCRTRLTSSLANMEQSTLCDCARQTKDPANSR